MNCGLTLAESRGAVDALLTHIARLSPLEALHCEGVTPCFGELRTHRAVGTEASREQQMLLLNHEKTMNAVTVIYAVEHVWGCDLFKFGISKGI